MNLLHLLSCMAIATGVQGSPIFPRSNTTYLPKRLIALEEHVISPSLEAEAVDSGAIGRAVDLLGASVGDKLFDVGAGRLADMDAGHLSLTVLSQAAALGRDDPTGCTEANDFVYDTITANPTRFAGFAVLPLAFPDQAAVELERSVVDLDFKGAMIWNHLADGTYLDEGDGRFDPIFSKAQDLDVPLYLHPSPPTQAVSDLLFAGQYVQPQTVGQLGTGAWGWHVDTGLAVLRLYGAGVFDRFPKLKIIIGHNGEGLPLFIDRVDEVKLRNDTTFAQVWNTNIWTTTSGFFTVRAFQQLRQVMPVERIMYSVDYPFSSVESGWQFVQELAEQRILTNDEMDLFAYKNAERLLRL